MATDTKYTTDQLDGIGRFAAGLAVTAREALDLGLGDDSSWDMLTAYAYYAAPGFISVGELRMMCDDATKLVLDEARAAGHPNVL